MSETSETVLQTVALTKRFSNFIAVQDLDLDLRVGEVFGLLGPNGSGKSTTVGMLLGLIRPTSGMIYAFGKPMGEHRWETLRRIGAIIESPAFYPYLSGRNNLNVMARSLGNIDMERIPAVLERVGLLARAEDRFATYSLGMKQRLGIASTLLRDPQIIILDEPTNGLDPAGTREVRDLIVDLAREGRTVLLCSHLLHEVEQTCDRVAILKRGAKLAEGPVAELLSRERALRLLIDGDGKIDLATETLRALPGVTDVRVEPPYIFVGALASRGAELNRALAERGIYVMELIPTQATLESVFLELTGEA